MVVNEVGTRRMRRVTAMMAIVGACRRLVVAVWVQVLEGGGKRAEEG